MEPEEHEYTVHGDIERTVKIRLYWVSEAANGHKWPIKLFAECTCEGFAVANAVARLIAREGMRSEFLDIMNQLIREMRDIGIQLFDRYVVVLEKYKHHQHQKGKGVWRKNLDHGPIFFFETIHISAPALRRRGLGQKLVSLLLNKAQKYILSAKGDGQYADLLYGSHEAFERIWTLHAFIKPEIKRAGAKSYILKRNSEERLMIMNQIQLCAITFWRSCGFRRIGASPYFAYSFDLQRPSHSLETNSDFDLQGSHSEDSENEILTNFCQRYCFFNLPYLKLERIRHDKPLHHAAIVLSDERLKAFLISSITHNHNWHDVTLFQSTLLHLTARAFKPQSTRWLVENIPFSQCWLAYRDFEGHTPIEALQDRLESLRTRREYGALQFVDVADSFRGHPEEAVACLALLFEKTFVRIDTECIRYGCTCRECLAGFLSPRMKRALIFQANAMYDFMNQQMTDGKHWAEFNDFNLEQLDPRLRSHLEFSISIRQGFISIFQIVIECLRANVVPTAGAISQYCDNHSQQHQYAKSYLECAGAQVGCYGVLRQIFNAAIEEDQRAGSGVCRRKSKRTWTDPPNCRNDYEYEFVAERCGYARKWRN
ncbi:hypothetical protein N7462_001568 [Penicillium macrosclerotiorum]|uniref:uncharacterized protein n=1 Tax=Penicillium macrosclerotiorum TaxID=303699 RepID=UPI0025491344|nr:uncharacterized protein N7462_001568 [Penicillium macrosclerotiorum]KAJ5692145.1 hypothetical protein N7462_001568 [Penicillium macrosclerotiorum]